MNDDKKGCPFYFIGGPMDGEVLDGDFRDSIHDGVTYKKMVYAATVVLGDLERGVYLDVAYCGEVPESLPEKAEKHLKFQRPVPIPGLSRKLILSVLEPLSLGAVSKRVDVELKKREYLDSWPTGRTEHTAETLVERLRWQIGEVSGPFEFEYADQSKLHFPDGGIDPGMRVKISWGSNYVDNGYIFTLPGMEGNDFFMAGVIHIQNPTNMNGKDSLPALWITLDEALRLPSVKKVSILK